MARHREDRPTPTRGLPSPSPSPPMNLSLEAVTTGAPESVVAVARIARLIWREHYTPIIGAAQVEYMLARFQSEQAIGAALVAGQEYWLMRVDGEPAGYLGLAPDREDPASLQLSKIYVRAQSRGSGLGKILLQRAEDRAAAQERRRLWLTVNRKNTDSLHWYQRQGFKVTGEVVTEIGKGFLMDDYRLEKWIGEVAR